MAAAMASGVGAEFAEVLERGGIRWTPDPVPGGGFSAPGVAGGGRARSRRFEAPRRGGSPAGRPSGSVRPRPLVSGGRTEMPTAPARLRAMAGSGRLEAAGHPLRLTRRGRVVALLFFAAVLLVVFGFGRATAGGEASPRHHATVIVKPGDSLWSIAARAFPAQDPREVVGQLERLNHLGGPEVQVGQTLRLP